MSVRKRARADYHMKSRKRGRGRSSVCPREERLVTLGDGRKVSEWPPGRGGARLA